MTFVQIWFRKPHYHSMSQSRLSIHPSYIHEALLSHWEFFWHVLDEIYSTSGTYHLLINAYPPESSPVSLECSDQMISKGPTLPSLSPGYCASFDGKIPRNQEITFPCCVSKGTKIEGNQSLFRLIQRWRSLSRQPMRVAFVKCKQNKYHRFLISIVNIYFLITGKIWSLLFAKIISCILQEINPWI